MYIKEILVENISITRKKWRISMKKILNRLALLLSMLAGFGFILASCAVHGSGGAFDKDEDNGGGKKGELTDAEIIEQYPNQFMFRYNGSSSDQFSDAAPYSITDFGKPDATTGLVGGGVFRYYPTAIDLSADTAEFSAVVKPNVDEGQQGVGFVQVSDGKVVGWWLVTTHNKIRYWNPNNAVEASKTSENGSGWDAGTKKDITSWTTGTEYTVKINLKTLTGSTGDTGEKGFEVLVYEGDSTTAAYEKYAKYGRWLTPDANSKIYFAIGTTKNDSSNTTWSNITAKVNDGETYTMKKIVDVQDQSAMIISSTTDVLGIKSGETSGDSRVYTYTAKDKDGGEVEPTIEVDDETVVKAVLDTTDKKLTVTALKEGNAKITLTNAEGTGKPSATLSIQVLLKGTVKLNGTEVDDLAAAFEGLNATTGGAITLSTGNHIVETGTQLVYSGTGEVTITGEGSKEYGTDVIIIGNPNTGAQGSRELIYLTGKSDFTIKNVTVKNTYSLSSDCQAEALSSNAAGHILAYNCTFDSHQDTIRTTGKSWFYKCHIKGDVDFLWMEKTGVVALYEDCKLTMVGDRKEAAYIAAPRSTYTTDGTIGKGLVVLDSTIVVEDGVDAYLFRNPWYKDTVTTAAAGQCYNNAAFIATTVESGELNSALVAKNGFGIGDNSVVGWKTDGASGFTASNVGTISAADLAAEYHNRGYILNRLIKIDGTATSYVTDEDALWNVTGKIETAETKKATENPAVSAFDPTNAKVIWDFATTVNDSFKDLLSGAAEISGSTPTWGFNSASGTMIGTVSKDDGTYADAVKLHINASSSKVAYRGTDTQVNANAVLTIPVTAGSKVTVTFKDAQYATASYLEGKSTTTATLSYDATETAGIILYTTANNQYLNNITVDGLDLTAFTGANASLLTGTASGVTRAVKITESTAEIDSEASATFIAKAYASYGGTPSEITWDKIDTDNVLSSVSGGNVQAASVTADKTATVIAKVSDTIKDSVSVTVKAVSAGTCYVSYYTAVDSASSLNNAGASSDNTVVASANITDAVQTFTGYTAIAGTKVPGYVGISADKSGSGEVEVGYIDFVFSPSVACKVTKISYKHSAEAASGNIYSTASLFIGDSNTASKTCEKLTGKAATCSESVTDVNVTANTQVKLRINISEKAKKSGEIFDIGDVIITVVKN